MYNTNYGTNDDNGGLNSAETQNYGTSIGDDSISDHAGGPLQWQQQDYTTRRNTRTTTTTTTTALPYLVYEDSFNSQRPTPRPTVRSTRATTPRSTSRATTPYASSNYWPNTSQQETSSTQHRPSYNDNFGPTTTQQQRPHNNGNNYEYTDEIPNTQQHQGTLQSSQFGNTHQQQPQGNQFGQQDNQYRPTQHQRPSTSSQFGGSDTNNNQNGGIPFSQPDASQSGLNQPDQDNFKPQGTSSNGNQGSTQPNRPNTNCRRSITTVNKKRITCKGTVIFEEQFDYNFESRWSQDVRMPLEDEVIEYVALPFVLECLKKFVCRMPNLWSMKITQASGMCRKAI